LEKRGGEHLFLEPEKRGEGRSIAQRAGKKENLKTQPPGGVATEIYLESKLSSMEEGGNYPLSVAVEKKNSSLGKHPFLERRKEKEGFISESREEITAYFIQKRDSELRGGRKAGL